MNRIQAVVKSPRFRWIAGVVIMGVAVIGSGLPRVGARLLFPNKTTDITSSDTTNRPHAARKETVRRVMVEAVTNSTEADVTTYPGTTKASQSSELAFRVSGPLIDVNIQPGDRVSCGDVLMRIDPRDFETEVKAAQATLDSARSKLTAMKKGARDEDVRALEANIDAAVARREYLQKHHARCENLVKHNAISRQEMDSTESQFKAAVAEIRALEQELEKAHAGSRVEEIQSMEADIRGMDTQLEGAQDALEDTRLLAPFDGTVTRQRVENHEQVAAGQIVVGLHNTSTIEIDVDLPEKELVHRPLRGEFFVTVRFVAVSDRCFEAALREMSTKADPATRTYKFTFAMPAPDDVNILPGMISEVQIESRANVVSSGPRLMIPGGTVQGDGHGERYVWVVKEDSTVERRGVELGWLSPNNRWEILSGLRQGERIVTSGAAFLYEGEQVVVESENVATDKSSRCQVKPHPMARANGS